MEKIIDAHCHVYPDKIAEKATLSTGKFYGLPPSFNGSLKQLKGMMNKNSINHAVIQSVATSKEQVSKINNFIHNSVLENDGIFTGLGTLHHESTDMEKDVNEIISLGLHGVKLHPDIQRIEVDDKRLMNAFDMCQGKLPFLIHTGDKRYDFSNPDRIKKVLDTFKDLTVIGAHFGGWSIWEEASDLLYKYDNFYVDTSSSFYAISPETSISIIKKYGTDRVLFGTDYPLWDAEKDILRIESLKLSDEDKNKIYYKNAMKVYNINL